MRLPKICPHEKPSYGAIEIESDDEEAEYRVYSATGRSGGRSTGNQSPTAYSDPAILIGRANRFAIQAEQWNKGGESREHLQKMCDIGDCVKTLRKKKHWTRHELAQRAALDPEQIFLLEHALLTQEEASFSLSRILLVDKEEFRESHRSLV